MKLAWSDALAIVRADQSDKVREKKSLPIPKYTYLIIVSEGFSFATLFYLLSTVY